VRDMEVKVRGVSFFCDLKPSVMVR
jgi:hypothetical protein